MASLRTRAVFVAALLPALASAQGMRLVAHSNLGGAGLNGDLTIVGTTAIVAAGMMQAGGVHAHLYNCRPFSAGHGAGFARDGTRGLLAFYDGGLFVLDLASRQPARTR
ncbi:hypothetical protein BH11GEM1_BH11GEM1_10710 [soil metagenome]